MRIIARRALREFWERHPDAEQPLRAWYHDVRKADSRSPADVKRVYANASIVGENRIVFNIGGNKYRLVVAINYPYRICYGSQLKTARISGKGMIRISGTRSRS